MIKQGKSLIAIFLAAVLLLPGCGRSEVITVSLATATSDAPTAVQEPVPQELSPSIPSTEPTIPESAATEKPTFASIPPTEAAEVTTAPTESAQTSQTRDYVLNTNSLKFHYPACSSAKQIKASNRAEYHGAREELIVKGYSPCGRCKP